MQSDNVSRIETESPATAADEYVRAFLRRYYFINDGRGFYYDLDSFELIHTAALSGRVNVEYPRGFDMDKPHKVATGSAFRGVQGVICWAREVLNSKPQFIDKVHTIPGAGRVVEDGNTKILNLWTPHELKTVDVSDEYRAEVYRAMDEFLAGPLEGESDEAKAFWFSYLRELANCRRTHCCLLVRDRGGSGKNTLQDIIEQTFFGHNAGIATSEEFNGTHSGSVLGYKQFVVVNEADLTKVGMARFKELVTEHVFKARHMRTEAVSIPNHTNLWVFSNEAAPLKLTDDDRRTFAISFDGLDRYAARARALALNKLLKVGDGCNTIRPDALLILRDYFLGLPADDYSKHRYRVPKTSIHAEIVGYSRDEIANIIGEAALQVITEHGSATTAEIAAALHRRPGWRQDVSSESIGKYLSQRVDIQVTRLTSGKFKGHRAYILK